MTNGEKMQEMFPEGKTRRCKDGVVFESDGWCHAYNFDWWNAEYKEPITKNDLPHCQHSDEEIAKSFIEDVEAVKDQLPCFCEQMDFPNTFDEFAKDYGFRDKEEIYTNGSELIPVFRVKQWLEHISTTKNDLGVDYISRQAVIDLMMQKWGENFSGDDAMQESIDTIRELPSVTPQESRWIPVSQRLPEEDGGYLVTVKQGYVRTSLWVGNAEYWNEVTAWMPLPQSYSEVEE